MRARSQHVPASNEQRRHAGYQQACKPAAGGRAALVWRWPHAHESFSMQAMRQPLAAGFAKCCGVALQEAATAAAQRLHHLQALLVSAALFHVEPANAVTAPPYPCSNAKGRAA